MRKIFAAFAAVLLIVTTAVAEEPDITGTWTLESGVVRTKSGETITFSDTSTAELIVTDQDGPVFSGIYRWSHPETMQDMHDGKQVTNFSEEHFVGVIHYDGKTITIADHPDVTIYSGNLIDANKIELISIEAGPHALAGRSILTRK